MIVHDDHSVGGRNDRRTKHIAGMGDALVDTANRDFFDADEMIASVEQNHAQRFLVQSSHLRTDEFVCQLRRVDFLFRQCLASQALAQSKCRHQLDRFREANTANFCQFVNRAATQAGQRAVSFQEFTPHFHRVRAHNSGAQKNRNQFRVREGGRAVRRKFLTRPLFLRHLTDLQLRHRYRRSCSNISRIALPSANSPSACEFDESDSMLRCASQMRSLPAAIDSSNAPFAERFFKTSLISSHLPSRIRLEQRSRSNSEAERRKISTGSVNLPLRKSVRSVLPVALSVPAMSRQSS